MANASIEDSIRAVEEDAVHFKKFFLFKIVGLENLRYDFINHLPMHIS
jgi:hypothetical protein